VELRTVGDSGLKVSEIGLGCNNFGTRMNMAEAEAVVCAALDAGVTLIDTADVYGQGKSEEMLGAALEGRRHDVVLATKFGLAMGAKRGGSRRYVMEAVEASLRRLKTDYIDLYQFHSPDADTPIEETLRALDDLVSQGKVLYLGNSNFTGWRIADADWTARNSGRNRFISAQNHYNLIERGIEEEVTPACERFGLGLLPYFPLAGGMLSGKYRRGEPAPQGTRLAFWGPRGEKQLSNENFDRLDRLTAWAAERGHTLLELAFAWLLGHKLVPSVIAGASTPEQVKLNVATAAWRLTPAEVAEVAQLAA